MIRLQLLTVCLMLCTLSYGQNQSSGQVINPINNPIPQQFGGQEIFRFQPGLVTQLQQGPDFGFNESQWFSIGNLNTGSQEVFGLRFQLPRRALTMGYQDTQDINPRIQWIGLGPGEFLGDLEFRVADDFGSTSSDLVATMRNDGGTEFASSSNFVQFETARVGVLAEQKEVGVYIAQKITPQVANTSYSMFIDNTSVANNNFGVSSIVNAGIANNNNIGVQGRVASAGTNNNIAILGEIDQTGTGIDFAGFFNGDVEITGSLFTASDKNLKENIEEDEDFLERINQLTPSTYNYIATKEMSLPTGKQYGFIAQELEEIFPELVLEVNKPVYDDERDIVETKKFKSVNYLGLISVLTGAVKELSEEVKELKENQNTYVVYNERFSEEEMDKIAENGFKLEQNYPNPFDSKTTIDYSIPQDVKDASIMIFNMTGKLLKEIKINDQKGSIALDAYDFESGIYLYSLVSGNSEIITKKMIVK